MAKKYDGMKYGYICLKCGHTIPYGVNEDGECKVCSKGYKRTDALNIARQIRTKQMRKGIFENIDDDQLIKKLKRIGGL